LSRVVALMMADLIFTGKLTGSQVRPMSGEYRA
jgi:hypothetical protein